MAIEHKFTYWEEPDGKEVACKLLEDGIYYMTIHVTAPKLSFKVAIVYAPYNHEHAIKKVLSEHNKKDLGINDSLTAKQVIHFKFVIIKFLSKVNPLTFERWKNSAANTKNNSIT